MNGSMEPWNRIPISTPYTRAQRAYTKNWFQPSNAPELRFAGIVALKPALGESERKASQVTPPYWYT